MAGISRSQASLRISGDDLQPTEISQRLGAHPTLSYRKGEVHGTRQGREYTRTTGMWSLNAEPREPEDLDGQVAEIIGKLTQDVETWKALSARYSIDLFCGLFMQESNEGLSLSPKTLMALADRNIEIGLDIYAPSSSDARD